MPYSKDAAKPRYFTCSRCNKIEDIFLYSPRHPLYQSMKESGLCYDCAYWMDYIAHPVKDAYIVSGALYKLRFVDEIYKPTSYGRRKYSFLINPSNRQISIATDLIFRGKVPMSFRERLPDQFKFLSEEEYRRFKEYQAEICLAKGCFDRYHCIWYDATIAEPSGPWNKIPRNYQIGGELCPSFINKNKIYDNL